MDWDVNNKLRAMGTLDFLTFFGGVMGGFSPNGLPLFASWSLLDMPQFRVIGLKQISKPCGVYQSHSPTRNLSQKLKNENSESDYLILIAFEVCHLCQQTPTERELNQMLYLKRPGFSISSLRSSSPHHFSPGLS